MRIDAETDLNLRFVLLYNKSLRYVAIPGLPGPSERRECRDAAAQGRILAVRKENKGENENHEVRF